MLEVGRKINASGCTIRELHRQFEVLRVNRENLFDFVTKFSHDFHSNPLIRFGAFNAAAALHAASSDF